MRAVRSPTGKHAARLTAPRGWEVTGSGTSYRVGPVMIEALAKPPASATELYTTECARAKEPAILKEEIPARNLMIVQCQLPGATGSGASLVVVHVAAVLRLGEQAVKCQFGTPRDPRALVEVCRSIRAKTAM